MGHLSDEEQKLEVRDSAKIGFRLLANPSAQRAIGMIHGMASNRTRWDEFINNTRLKKNWNLLAFDLRGHNSSLWYGRFTRKKWVQDLFDVMKAKKFSQVIMIGHSMGAQVAMQYAMQYRDDINALVLIDPIFDKNLTGKLALARRTKYILWIILLFTWLFNFLGIRKRRFKSRSYTNLISRRDGFWQRTQAKTLLNFI